ncbi:MAG TPA: LuxR family transcriptional regulator [Streptosporangiaceae bacterium]
MSLGPAGSGRTMAAGPRPGSLGLGDLGLGNLIGRDDELSVVGEMLRDTGGRGLLLVGEPGIGKSALLRAATAMAGRDGRAVLRTAGVQAETGVPYAGLHQLLYPLAGSFPSLAPRPREALRAAFGQADGPPPEMFPVAVAALELLARAATDNGLLVVADDLHWMDDATLGVLRFVARRIASVPIALLAAIRPGFEDVLVEADLPVLMLRPFDVDGEGGLTALPRLLAQQARSAIAIASPSLWQAPELIGQAMIAGLRGEDALAGQLTRQAEAMVLPAGIGAALGGIQFVRGVTAIGARRYDEAFDHLSRMFDRADPACQAGPGTWALGDLAEAGARSGRADEAREILAAFRPAGYDGVTAWTRVALLYAAPLLADEDDAEQEFRRALEADLVRWPFYRARLLLEYGSWLRRRRRIAEARAPLRHAHQVCEAHGLLPWAERALAELRATGESRAAFRAEERMPLSPQERQIARLAAEGLSNREIGQRLYLSHRTIGSHLYRIFPKLGITSRAQLGAALADGLISRGSGTALPPSPEWTKSD